MRLDFDEALLWEQIVSRSSRMMARSVGVDQRKINVSAQGCRNFTIRFDEAL
jgi:hypothetical protein